MYQGIAFDTHVRIVAMSIKELTAQLTEMKETLRTREKLHNDLGQVRQSREEELTRRNTLAATLRKETRDVERLEGLCSAKTCRLDRERLFICCARIRRRGLSSWCTTTIPGMC